MCDCRSSDLRSCLSSVRPECGARPVKLEEKRRLSSDFPIPPYPAVIIDNWNRPCRDRHVPCRRRRRRLTSTVVEQKTLYPYVYSDNWRYFHVVTLTMSGTYQPSSSELPSHDKFESEEIDLQVPGATVAARTGDNTVLVSYVPPPMKFVPRGILLRVRRSQTPHYHLPIFPRYYVQPS